MVFFVVVLAGAAALLFGGGGASAVSSPPVDLGQQVNNKGTKDVSAKTSAKFEVELDDFYFKPTFIKVQPGEKLTLKIHNEGTTAHTFTSDALGVDKVFQPDKKGTVKITVPSDATVAQFHCDFHGQMGMDGAIFTAAGQGQAPPAGGA
jgi:plastocyanin